MITLKILLLMGINMKLTEANWQPYFGNNSISIPKPDIIAGGCVSFKKHLGKPLTQELWNDLIHRLKITGLCIYRFNDFQWLCKFPSNHYLVYLDENDNISDIKIFP